MARVSFTQCDKCGAKMLHHTEDMKSTAELKFRTDPNEEQLIDLCESCAWALQGWLRSPPARAAQ